MADEITSALTLDFQSSLQQGRTPTDWNTASHTNLQEGRKEQTIQLSPSVSNISLLQSLGTRYTQLHHVVL